MNKKLLLGVCFFSVLHSYAFDLDMTVDDDIRKNYNSSKLINDIGIIEELPELPSINDDVTTSTKVLYPNEDNVNNSDLSLSSVTSAKHKIKKGTVFDVVSLAQISDWQKSGTSVKFKTKNLVSLKKCAIPAGTVFVGEIVDSHAPQITCNGGLVAINIHSMIYKGRKIPLRAYIIRADGEKIFLNNIKGDRTYLKTMWKKGNWGRTIFNKMLSLTVNLGAEGSTLLLSPFPFAYGTICLGLNSLTSPICAFFSKGKHVSIPSGSDFRIKLSEDIYID